MKNVISNLFLAFFMLNVTGQLCSQSLFGGLDKFRTDYLTDECPDGESRKILHNEALRYTDNRRLPYPDDGNRLICNPPVFTWPMLDYEHPDTFPLKLKDKAIDDFIRYDFQLSRNSDFSGSSTVLRKGLRFAFYNNHSALSPGVWYWRYRSVGGDWSRTFRVHISEDLPLFESPLPSQAYEIIPSSHPRVFRRYNDTGYQGKILADYYIKSSRAALVKDLSSYKVKGKPIPPDATPQEIMQINRFKTTYEFDAITGNLNSLLFAYQSNGEDKYLEKAMELVDYILLQDPEEFYKKNEFSGTKVMASISKLYDMAYSRLSSENRKKYESFITTVIPLVLSHQLQENISSADGILSAHFFQKTFYDTFYSSIIMKGHHPESRLWFEMLYSIWLSRSPGGGFLSDGVWPNGNVGYVHVNMESMVDVYLLYRDLFGVRTFEHPWYRNCSVAMPYVVPVNSCGDGFGDGAESLESGNYVRSAFSYILGKELNNPLAIDYAYKLNGQSPEEPFRFSKSTFGNYRMQMDDSKPSPTDIHRPRSAVFPETGIVAMHTDLENSSKDLFLSFRSSPFGVGSHGHGEQNSFNIMYGGRPVFYPTGYRITTQDRHYLLCQKHSRGKNTITVDGKTQAYSHRGYGWIARYLEGDDITYALGDASNAYKPLDKSVINWITVLNNNDAYTSENGFIMNEGDDPKVTTFRRHIALLRPNVVVVYDELESDKEVTWTFQLNSREESRLRLVGKELFADAMKCDARVTVMGSSELGVSLADTSFIKPFDWLNPQRGRKAIVFEKNQYHSKFENKEKCRKMRYLAIIQIDGSKSDKFKELRKVGNGRIAIGDYMISANMDVDSPARLSILNSQTGEHLLFGENMKGDAVDGRKCSGSTVLLSPSGKLQETVDLIPGIIAENK